MRWRPAALMLIGLAAFSGGTLWAQESEEKVYLDEDYPEPRRWSFGLAAGLVELGDNVIEGQQIVNDDDVETYFAASLRIPFGDRRAHEGPARRGFRSYLEPEAGYWDGDLGSDFLLGLNIVGAVPYNSVEFFVGGGVAVHFLDQDLELGAVEDFSDEALGVNAHFGVDVSISEMLSVSASVVSTSSLAIGTSSRARPTWASAFAFSPSSASAAWRDDPDAPAQLERASKSIPGEAPEPRNPGFP